MPRGICSLCALPPETLARVGSAVSAGATRAESLQADFEKRLQQLNAESREAQEQKQRALEEERL